MSPYWIAQVSRTVQRRKRPGEDISQEWTVIAQEGSNEGLNLDTGGGNKKKMIPRITAEVKSIASEHELDNGVKGEGEVNADPRGSKTRMGAGGGASAGLETQQEQLT